MSQTKVRAELVELSTGQSLEDRLNDVISAASFGASPTASIAVNTAAINAAIALAATTSGAIDIGQGVQFNEAALSIPDNVVVHIYTDNGTEVHLTKYHGSTLPVTKGGLVVKSQGQNGNLMRSLDYGVPAEPILQLLDATTGDIAGLEYKFAEIHESTDVSAPAANKVRLFARDNGSGKTQLCARFPTGAVQVIATEP